MPELDIDSVATQWTCDCGGKTHRALRNVADMGSPVCPNCEGDMKLASVSCDDTGTNGRPSARRLPLQQKAACENAVYVAQYLRMMAGDIVGPTGFVWQDLARSTASRLLDFALAIDRCRSGEFELAAIIGAFMGAMGADDEAAHIVRTFLDGGDKGRKDD